MLHLSLIAAALLGSLAVRPPDDAVAPERGDGTEIAAILTGSGRDEAKVALLAGLGAGRLPELFEALCERLDRDPGATPARLLIVAMGRIGPSAVWPVIEPRSASPDPDVRRAVLAVLELLGGRGELRLATAAAAHAPAGVGFDPGLVEPFERAALAILRSSPTAHAEISALVRGAPPEVATALVRASAEVGGPAALEALGSLLGADPYLEATVLGHLGRAARFSLAQPPAELLARVRLALAAPDPAVVRAALQAVGQLDDTSAVEACIELLDSPARPVAAGAHAALARITGLALPADAGRWRAWYRADREWLDAEAPEAFDMLRSPEAAVRRRGVELVLQHRLERHRLALELTCLLEADEPDLRLLGVTALRRLGSRTVVPELIEARSDPSPEVADAAWRTLRELTGRDFAIDSVDWLDLLEP